MKRHELFHHGIPGQKWGKRNGPPYPLVKRSAAERKAALDKPKQKSYNKSKAVERGRYAVGSILGKIGDKPVSELTGNLTPNIKMLARPESVDEVLKNANPTKSHNNCYNCVVAATARMCGLDVMAKEGLPNGRGISFDDVCKVFKLNPDDPKDVVRVLNPNMDKVVNQIAKRYSDGDVGAIGFAWNETYKQQSGSSADGHTVNWIVSNGTVEFLDAQIGWRGNKINDFIASNMSPGKEVSIARFATANENNAAKFTVDLPEFKNFVR